MSHSFCTAFRTHHPLFVQPMLYSSFCVSFFPLFVCFVVALLIHSIFLALFLSPSVFVTNIRDHQAGSSPPSPLLHAPSIFLWQFSFFFARPFYFFALFASSLVCNSDLGPLSRLPRPPHYGTRLHFLSSQNNSSLYPLVGSRRNVHILVPKGVSRDELQFRCACLRTYATRHMPQ